MASNPSCDTTQCSTPDPSQQPGSPQQPSTSHQTSPAHQTSPSHQPGPSRYSQRGVSSKKEDVHKALEYTDEGLFPGAFCKVTDDVLTGSEDHCTVVHADGAGSKSSLAYIAWRESGDCSVFEGISQDSIVMNIDDLLCIGALGPFLLSSTVGRNAKVVSGEVISSLVKGTEAVARRMTTDWGLAVVTTGGETADNGDVVRTVDVNSTVVTRMRRADVISNSAIAPGNVIIGLSSTGQATYERRPNSGMGSNGLTMARHELLNHSYFAKYPESCQTADEANSGLLYSGPYFLSDVLRDPNVKESEQLTIGEALLSPTRSYAPIIKNVLSNASTRAKVTGIIHCSGGGQTKCIRFGKGVCYRKNNLFPCPPLFSAIKAEAGKSCMTTAITWREMYQVFNMGHRMEIIGEASLFDEVSKACSEFNIGCQIVGHVEKTSHPEGQNEVFIEANDETLHYVN